MDKLENPIGKEDDGDLLASLNEGKELEKWQRYFCDMANIFVCCMDSQGNPLTSLDGNNGEETLKINKIIDGEQFQNMLLRVSESTLEDQAIETTVYPNVRLAVISGKAEGKPVINWLVCGVLSDAEDLEDYENPPLEGIENLISRKQFARAVDAIRGMTDMMLQYKSSAAKAQAESRKSRRKQQETEENLKRSKAFNEVAQLLGSKDKEETTVRKLLALTGTFLGVSTAALCRNKGENGGTEIVAKWCEKKTNWHVGKEIKDREFSLFKRQRAVVISPNAIINDREKEEIDVLGLKALIVIPVVLDGKVCMHAVFGETDKERMWELEEIKFINDSVKILQKILARGI